MIDKDSPWYCATSGTSQIAGEYLFDRLHFTVNMCPFCGYAIDEDTKVKGKVKVRLLGHTMWHKLNELDCWTCDQCTNGIDECLRLYCFGSYMLWCFRRTDYLKAFFLKYKIELNPYSIQKLTPSELQGKILADRFVRLKNIFRVY